MTQADAEHTGVVMPPPAIYALALLLTLVLHWSWSPLPVLDHPATFPVGVAFLLAGLGINGWGLYTLHQGDTTINPVRPAQRMITSGPFRFSRNPLYIGVNLAFIGLVLMINTLWGLLLWIPVLVLMHYGVIRREEQHLRARFGEEFEAYCSKVRRYL